VADLLGGRVEVDAVAEVEDVTRAGGGREDRAGAIGEIFRGARRSEGSRFPCTGRGPSRRRAADISIVQSRPITSAPVSAIASSMPPAWRAK